MAQARLQCRRGRRTPQQDHGERSQAMSTSPLFNNKILVVNQKAKLIEVTNQYSVSDADGNVIAHVNEVGQSKAKKLLRVVSSVDQFLTHKLEITDATGAVVLTLTRPAKVFKSTVIVGKAENWRAWDFAIENADGREVARVTKKFVGLAKAVFTTADNYVVEIHDDLSQPLASLVVAAALSIDTALKQDSKL
ncbi:MAG: scramblase [Actinobacteria bacterium]|nr:scramblase [Actinomycetota bacterium]